MARILLVAGAFHGAWSWEFVIPRLEARGHSAVAVELPGMASDHTPLDGIGLGDWALKVAAAVTASDEPAILVGHSRGGIVISQAAELVPEQLRLNIYLAAILVGNGKTALDLPRSSTPDGRNQAFPTTPDGLAYLHGSELADFAYANSSPELVARANARICPEPVFALKTPLRLSAARYGRVPRAYIECLDDQVVPIELQRAMQALEPCHPVRTIATDHCPNYSAPDLLADTLDEIVRSA